ncbi:hypothetical protein [Mycobacterium sp. 236(2023)]|uniref:hypothetical protein n=1 Tax=Mycobacterium sp. 236(2023) TaxID=3038163 RepID=UPI002414E5F2|nr:hypothetical protein [Mycobacterium sp. 236(2023)]MDG4667460.1 hypothetical protein [Mycobacterium sp. 236(2023)]
MNTTRFGIALIAAAIAAGVLSGCSQVADLRSQATDVAEMVMEKSADAASGDPFTAEGIDAAYSAIAEQAGGKPLQVVEVVVVPGTLTLQAVDPAAPTELNQWSFTAGTVGPSRPVDYDDDTEALRQNLFSIDEVPAGVIASAVDEAVTASGIPDGEVSSLVIQRNLPFDDSVLMLINVDGERSSKQVRADVTGQITEVI